jgi:hypothetical protein
VNNKFKFILVWLILCLLIVPILNAGLTTLVKILFEPNEFNLFSFAGLVWAWTLIMFSWTLFGLVIIPYSVLCVFTVLGRKPIIFRLVVFYALLVFMGLILPEASIGESFRRGDTNRIWLLYFLVTIILCPISNFVLAKLIRTDSTQK